MNGLTAIQTVAYILSAILIVTELVSVGEALPEILDSPDNSYAMLGTNVTMRCNTRSDTANWVLNDTALTITHLVAIEAYEDLGVVFLEESSGGFHNLTMVIPATIETNNTKIRCTSRTGVTMVVMTDPVYLYVFDTLSPYPPSLSVDVVYSLSRPPVINVTIIGRPRWPSYVISEFIMNITTLSNGSLLSENVMYIENNCTNNTCFLNLDADELMPTTSLSYECNTLRVAVSSVSEAYGEGEPSQKDSMILKALEKFPKNAVNHTTLFSANGALFSVSLQIQLPLVCVHQPVIYTLLIEDLDQPAGTTLWGPYQQLGPGVVSHRIKGLQKDQRYSVRVMASSLIWSSESNKYYFDTKLKQSTCLSPIGGLTETSNGDGGFYYAIALGVPLVIVVLVLLIVIVLFVCFCIYNHNLRKNSKLESNRQSMVQNPIYDGPVYEVVTATSLIDDGNMAPLKSTDIHMATMMSSDNHNTSPLPIHYVDEPTEARSHLGKTSISSGYDHLTNHKGCRPACGRALRSPVDSDESYTIMASIGTLNGQC